MADLDDIEGAFLAAFRPPPRRRLSEWIEANIVLPSGVSAQPGPVRLWPYQREIADAIGHPSIERVTLVKPVRVGFTSLLTAALGGYIANDPAPIISLQPTEQDCRNYVVSDVEPTLAESPALHGMLTTERREGSRNTMLSRRFSGGSLKIIAAKAPRNLRAHTARVLFIDEADAMEAGAEGDPITLATRRTLSFPDRKIVVGSTPTFEDTSAVLRLYCESDQRVFEVPCPECGTFTEILWRHIEWEPDKPDTAAFRCPHCEALVDERHKPRMVEAGRWTATAPAIPNHAGFRLNALVSLLTNASWGRLAKEFVAAKDRPDQLQVFVNTILAEGWREAAEEVDDEALASRAEPFGLERLPPNVLAITAGVDVQRKDRLEVTFVGWGEDDEMFILSHRVLYGSPQHNETWRDLDHMLRERWTHPLGGTLGVDAAVVDSGDGVTVDKVYAFCRERAGRRILAGKGMAGSRQALTIGGKVRGGGRVHIIGVDGLKGQLLTRLQSGRSVRFSDELGPSWFEQLTAERRVVRYERGHPTRRWVRKAGQDAEALDCTVYAMAARHAVVSNLAIRRDELAHLPTPSKAPTVVRSAWMGR
ncbi:MAG: phage terminase large subunit family protein [Pseudomonadota bacterium]